jgi:hypothetical protein
LISTVNLRLRCGKPAKKKKKGREHQRFRGAVLLAPGSFPLQNDPLSPLYGQLRSLQAAFFYHAEG